MKEAVIYLSGPSCQHQSNSNGFESKSIDRRPSEVSEEEMLANASRGIYPGCVPFGYRNNNAQRTIEIDPLESRMVSWMFELYVSGKRSLKSISQAVQGEFGVWVSSENIRAIVHDCFYIGAFEWQGRWYSGTHPIFLRSGVFHQAQVALNRGMQTDIIADAGGTDKMDVLTPATLPLADAKL